MPERCAGERGAAAARSGQLVAAMLLVGALLAVASLDPGTNARAVGSAQAAAGPGTPPLAAAALGADAIAPRTPQTHVDLAGAQTLAAAAAKAYENGDFARSAEGFGRAIAAGLDHPSLHYNLGNAYFKNGQLGKSIASYLRALRRNPRDRALRANLQRAQSLIRDEALAPLSLPIFLRPVGWVYRNLSLNEWAALLLVGLFLLAIVGIAAQWGVLRPSLRRATGWIAVGIATLGLAMAAVHYRAEVVRTTAVVVAVEVEVRSGPGKEYNLAFKIHEGLQVFVSERRGDWVQIDLGGRLVGWVPVDRIEGV
jgi:tetratricopeptide (TPR) repeat protein